MLESFLALLTNNIPIRCSPEELARFSPPPGQSCSSYAGAYAQQVGGYVESLAGGQCGFCQFRDGTMFSQVQFNVFPSHIWRNFGIMWGYVVFNFAVVFACTWLYLGGFRRIRGVVSMKGRRQKRAMGRGEKSAA